jgi:hypothetical protein
MAISAGDTFLIQSGNVGLHLFVVAIEVLDRPGNQKNQRLLVPICTAFEKCDHTCLISASEHPFVKHPSYVAYNKARSETESHLLMMEKNSVISRREPLDSALLLRIVNGLNSSDRLPNFFRELL